MLEISNSSVQVEATDIPVLVCIVEVPPENSILCQAPLCGHKVYKRIHVVKTKLGIQVLGSECYAKLFGNIIPSNVRPLYGSGDGRALSEHERQLLIENTELLIAYFEKEYFDSEQNLHSFQEIDETPHWLKAQDTCPWIGEPGNLRPREFSEEQWAEAMREARTLAFKYLSNPDAIGWLGLIKLEAAKLLRAKFSIQPDTAPASPAPTPSHALTFAPTQRGLQSTQTGDLFGDLF